MALTLPDTIPIDAIVNVGVVDFTGLNAINSAIEDACTHITPLQAEVRYVADLVNIIMQNNEECMSASTAMRFSFRNDAEESTSTFTVCTIVVEKKRSILYSDLFETRVYWKAYQSVAEIPILYEKIILHHETRGGRRYGICGPRKTRRWTEERLVPRGMTANEINRVQNMHLNRYEDNLRSEQAEYQAIADLPAAQTTRLWYCDDPICNQYSHHPYYEVNTMECEFGHPQRQWICCFCSIRNPICLSRCVNCDNHISDRAQYAMIIEGWRCVSCDYACNPANGLVISGNSVLQKCADCESPRPQQHSPWIHDQAFLANQSRLRLQDSTQAEIIRLNTQRQGAAAAAVAVEEVEYEEEQVPPEILNHYQWLCLPCHAEHGFEGCKQYFAHTVCTMCGSPREQWHCVDIQCGHVNELWHMNCQRPGCHARRPQLMEEFLYRIP